MYNWTTREDEQLAEKFKLVFYLNLKLIKKGVDLMEAIVDQCLPPHYKKTPHELYTIINGKQNKTLLLLDGFEGFHGPQNNDIYDVLNRRRLREVALILAVSSHRFVESSLNTMFDNHLVLLGFKEQERDDCMLKYCYFTEQPNEMLGCIHNEILHPFPSRIHAFTLNPLFCKFLCLIAQYDGNIAAIQTEADLLDEFLIAIQKHFCIQHNLQMEKSGKYPRWCLETMQAIEEIAYEQGLTCQVVTDMRMITMKYKKEGLFSTGLLVAHKVGHKSNNVEFACFISQIVQDYISSKMLAKLEPEDFERHIDELVSNKFLHNVTKLLFSFSRTTCNVKGLKTIVERVAKANRRKWKSLTFNAESSNSAPTSQESMYNGSNHIEAEEYEGQLSQFALSLDCISQCPDRSVAMTFARSLAGRLFMKSNEVLSDSQLCGLAKLICQNEPNLRAVEVRLDGIGLHYSYAMQSVAMSIARSAHITSLRIYWINAQLLSNFLAAVFDGNNISVEMIKIHDQTRSDRDYVSASVWKGLWTATKGMDQITSLSFTQCHNPAMVSGLLRNLPSNVDTLMLNNCSLDQVGAQYLQTAFSRNTTRLHTVSLHGVQMKKPDFTYICNGLKTSLGLQELDVSGCKLDARQVITLTEALKLNKSLRVLNIAGAAFTEEAARAFAVAIAMNKSLRKIRIHDVEITDMGLVEIMTAKREGLLLLGHEKKLQRLYNMDRV